MALANGEREVFLFVMLNLFQHLHLNLLLQKAEEILKQVQDDNFLWVLPFSLFIFPEGGRPAGSRAASSYLMCFI